MKGIKAIFHSFRTKVTLVLILSLFFVACLSNFLVYRYALNAQFNQLREKLKVIAQTAALSVDPDLLMKVPLDMGGLDTPQYKIIAEKLMSIKKANHPIKYIYTMAKTDTEGIWQFVVDPVPPTKEELRRGVTSYPGDKYDASRFSEMMKAFNGPPADKELEIDEWGVTLSGYAPIRNKGGEAVAMLGVDIMAEDVYAIHKGIRQRGLFVLILGIIFSVSLGMIISNRITNPVKKLVEGTRHIANGDLKHQVDIAGSDEIGELAVAFNRVVPYQAYQMHFGSIREKNHIPAQEMLETQLTNHAEVEILELARRQRINLKGATFYINIFPCPICAKMLSRTEINGITYSQDHNLGNDIGYKVLKISGKKIKRVVF